MNEHLNFSRLGLLIRNDFVGGLRGFLTACSVIGIIMMLYDIPSVGYGDLVDGFYDKIFVGFLFIGGTIHASHLFLELTDKKQNESYLLLPASALEKTLARYLHGSIFFIFYILVFTTVAALLIEGINLLLFSRTNDLFNPFSSLVWDAIAAFMIVQPMFFLGGAWFRRYRWFKTVISAFIISGGLGLLACLAFIIFFAEDIPGFILIGDAGLDHGMSDLDWRVNENLFESILIGLKLLCYVFFPLFCIYLTWLRVRETQVSHGV